MASIWHQGIPPTPEVVVGLFIFDNGDSFAELCYYDPEDEVWYSGETPYDIPMDPPAFWIFLPTKKDEH